MSSLEEIKSEAKSKMQKSLESLNQDFAAIHTGRASTALLKDVLVETYGQKMPLHSLASMSVADPKTILVSPWDEANLQSIDSAIRKSGLGLNPRVEGKNMFVPLPDITSERRQELVRVIRRKSEEAKVSIRNVRRVANDKLKALEKDIGEDAFKSELKNIQSLTDDIVGRVGKAAQNKQHELESF